MICPKCQISLTVTNRFSIDANDCPKCHGIWLEQSALEIIMQETQPIDKNEKEQTNTIVIEEKIIQKSPGTRHFLSGALDIYDDW